jgi:hypothetical protein
MMIIYRRRSSQPEGPFTITISIVVRSSSSDACERVDELWMSEFMYPRLNIHNSSILVHMRQKMKIALEIAAKLASACMYKLARLYFKV